MVKLVKGDTVRRRWGRFAGTRGIVAEVAARRLYVRWETKPGQIMPDTHSLCRKG